MRNRIVIIAGVASALALAVEKEVAERQAERRYYKSRNVEADAMKFAEPLRIRELRYRDETAPRSPKLRFKKSSKR